MPRDLFLMVQSGRAYILVTPDGRKWYHMATIKSVSESLDAIAQLPGAMMFRGAEVWEIILPASDAGQILVSQSGDAAPAWQNSGAASPYERARAIPQLPNFTLMNPGSGPTAKVAVQGTFGIELRIQAAGGGCCFLRWDAGLPAGNWQVIQRAQEISTNDGNLGIKTGFVMRNSANGRLIFLGHINGQWKTQQATSYGGAGTDIIGPFSAPWLTQAPWLRVTNIAGTVTIEVGPDGEAWSEMGSFNVSTFIGAIDELGPGNYGFGETFYDLFQSFEIAAIP